jgi:hypothetical protein
MFQFSIPWLVAEQIHKEDELTTWSSGLLCIFQSLFQRNKGRVERNVPGWHSSNNTVPILPERFPPTKRTSRPKRCAVCYKNSKSKETVFWCPDCEACLYWGRLQDIPHEAQILR